MPATRAQANPADFVLNGQLVAGASLAVPLALGTSASASSHRISVELGALKGNQGDQDYPLPANTDVTRYSLVVIYCERFRAVFGTASLEPF